MGTKPSEFFGGFFIFYRMVMWHVYVLRSEKDNLRYVDITQDIERRLAEHYAGRSRFTSTDLSWKLGYGKPSQAQCR
ncbi:MAG: GIY-YIG nuclease family protein [Bacteroidetes bacterium]|nr:GIY-YIG nuclease family protein [Bacteroidota bacterium]MBS1540841.1 GIY-YIG nuclease family protein [Bacteroidota bacterium]